MAVFTISLEQAKCTHPSCSVSMWCECMCLHHKMQFISQLFKHVKRSAKLGVNLYVGYKMWTSTIQFNTFCTPLTLTPVGQQIYFIVKLLFGELIQQKLWQNNKKKFCIMKWQVTDHHKFKVQHEGEGHQSYMNHFLCPQHNLHQLTWCISEDLLTQHEPKGKVGSSQGL